MGNNTDGLTDDQKWLRADWMQTYTGKKFYPTAPNAADVDPLDIAHALSMQCRYNGHVKEFYSVAEHCWLISHALERDYGSRDLALWGLLHDATEAYVGDMVRPLKKQIPAFSEVEDRVMKAIAERFDLFTETMPPEVKDADNRILVDEKAALMGKQPGAWSVDGLKPLRVYIKAWDPTTARNKYMERLIALTGEEVAVY